MRRRTPGLRRAELATLADVSVEYLTRLEQGRDRHPSAQVLAAIADALRLGPEDLSQLRRLAAISFGEELCPASVPPTRDVRPMVQALLDRLEPSPAVVLNRVSDLLSWTPAYARLVGPVGLLDGDRPNLVRWVFTDKRAQMAHPDWEALADELVGGLQAGHRPDGGESHELLAELGQVGGPAFTSREAARPVVGGRSGVMSFVHPEVGDLRLAFETLLLPEVDDQRLVVYLAADAATSTGLDRLTGRRPGALRAVSDL